MPKPLAPAELRLPADTELPLLLQRCPDIEAMSLTDGDMLLREGEPGQDLYLLFRGSLVIEKSGERLDASPRILAALEAAPDSPAIVGEMAYFGSEARTASVRSVGASQVLRLTPKHVDQVLEAFPELTRLLFRQFTKRLQETSASLRELQSRMDLAAERRLAQPGETLIEAGSTDPPLLELAAGALLVDGPQGPRRFGPGDLPEGFLLPEVWLRGGPWPATVTAAETSFIAMIPASRREAFVASRPGLVLRWLHG